MSGKTGIEWCDATWNPTTGCTKVSAGCKFCYAEREFPRVYPGRPFNDVRVHEDRLDQPLRWKRPRKIFVNSMSDLFHEKVPGRFIWGVMVTMIRASQHTFQILTKRPGRMKDWMEGWGEVHSSTGRLPAVPSNVWLGVSVEDQKTADERIPLLLRTPAAVRFVSYEPALGPLNLRGYLKDETGWAGPKLTWVIAGGESGPNARSTHPDWIRSARDQCQAAGVPFFFKQRGEWSWDRPEPLLRFPTTHHLCQHGNLQDIRDHTWNCRADGCSVYAIAKVGKKRAGRLLEGREWNQFPKARGHEEA